MLGSANALIAATLAFVGGHFLLSSRPLRPALNERLGERGFRILYSAAMTLALIWMVAAYRAAPVIPVWEPAPVLAWVPLLVMPVASILLVAGLTSPNPTLVGGERFLDGAPGSPAVDRSAGGENDAPTMRQPVLHALPTSLGTASTRNRGSRPSFAARARGEPRRAAEGSWRSRVRR